MDGNPTMASDVFSAGVTLLELWVGSIGKVFDEYDGVDEVGCHQRVTTHSSVRARGATYADLNMAGKWAGHGAAAMTVSMTPERTC